MKRIVSLLLAVVMLLGCAAVLASCSAPEDDGAQIKVYLGNAVYDLDPTDYYADSNAEQLMSLLFEPLFALNEKGELINGAAGNYWVDEYENTITVELRETYWSDDSRVKAEDFVYAWCEKLLNPNNPNPAAALLYDIENAAAAKTGDCSISDVGVVATGTYQLTITYCEGADYNRLLRNLASVATAPVKQSAVDKAPTYWSKELVTTVTNGAFKVSAYNPADGEFHVSRNNGYHQHPETVDYDNNVVPGDLYAVFTTGREAVKLSYSDLEEKTVFVMSDASMADRADNKGKAVAVDDTSVYTYVFNTEHPLLSNQRVREALLISIDRQAIVEAITFGKAADGFLPDICGGSADELISATAKLARAKALVSNIDLSEPITISVDDDEESKVIAELVAASWTAVGFNISIEYLAPVATTVAGVDILDSGVQVALKEASYGNRTFDVLGVDWQLYSNDAFVGLAAFTGNLNGCGVDFKNNERRSNVTGWSNVDYDFYVNEARKFNGEERAELLAKAEELLISAAPVCPIIFNQSFVFSGSLLSGVAVDGIGNFVYNQAVLENYHDYLVEVEEPDDDPSEGDEE